MEQKTEETKTAEETRAAEETSTTWVEELDSLMFDEKLKEIFRRAATAAFLKVPELRGVVIGFDYYGGIGDAPTVTKGLWLKTSSESRQVVRAVGALDAACNLLDYMMEEVSNAKTEMVSELTDVAKALVERTRELEAIKERIRNNRLGVKHTVDDRQIDSSAVDS